MDGQVSPAVEEANRRLYAMRAELAARRARSGDGSPGDEEGHSRSQVGHGPEATARLATGKNTGALAEAAPVNWPLINAQRELRRRRLDAPNSPATTPAANHDGAPAWLPRPPANGNRQSSAVGEVAHPPAAVTVHPTMLQAILRQEREAAARVWLLLRLADRDGRGWLTIDEARRELTASGAPLFVCGWRRLRQLLAEGEGVFWVREARSGGDRLWLRGAHRVAVGLDCRRLQGFPVELPTAALLGSIQGVRAAFYAAFHAGREARPISRATVATLCGVAERTQLAYDQVAGVARTRNIAVGERYSADSARERAWQHGRAVFRFTDTAGKQGRPGDKYVAWRLPNSYHAAYQRRSRGSRKRLNRKIDDLVTKGIPGNDERAVEPVFHANGALAARQFNRDPRRDAYWRQQDRRRGRALWGVIAGQRAGIGGLSSIAGRMNGRRTLAARREPMEREPPASAQPETPRRWRAVAPAGLSPAVRTPNRPPTAEGKAVTTPIEPATPSTATRKSVQ